jgi:hypothetical protein
MLKRALAATDVYSAGTDLSSANIRSAFSTSVGLSNVVFVRGSSDETSKSSTTRKSEQKQRGRQEETGEEEKQDRQEEEGKQRIRRKTLTVKERFQTILQHSALVS